MSEGDNNKGAAIICTTCNRLDKMNSMSSKVNTRFEEYIFRAYTTGSIEITTLNNAIGEANPLYVVKYPPPKKPLCCGFGRVLITRFCE